MKFPTTQSPFGDYPALSEAQTEQLEHMTQRLLAETLADYDTHKQKQRRLLPRSQYKAVKKVENLICYRQRSAFAAQEAAQAARQSFTRTTDPAASDVESEPTLSATASYPFPVINSNGDATWRLPKLVTVGTVVGTLDDVMFGMITPDATSAFIRASYNGEDLLDSEVLHCLEAPTPEQPFRFCGVKWHVMGLTKMSRKRDFVFVEASGIVTRTNGHRMGYHIMHSVDLPGLGKLTDEHQLTRARVVSCHVFRQFSNGTVDVYMKALVDPSGDLPNSMAIASTATALLKLGHAVECAHSKKIEHLLEQQQLKGSTTMRRTSASSRSSGHSDRSSGSNKGKRTKEPCAVCATTLHIFRSVAHCELCAQVVCSHCRVTRRLSYRVARPKELKQKSTVLCTSCVTSAVNYSAFDIAQTELVADKLSQATFSRSIGVGGSGSQSRYPTTNSILSANNTVLSSNYCALETPVEEDDEDETAQTPEQPSEDFSKRGMGPRRRSMTHPPVTNEKTTEPEKLAELDLSLSLSIVSSMGDGSDFTESEASRRKTQPPISLSDLSVTSEDVDPVHPLVSSLPPMKTAPTSAGSPHQHRELMQRMSELRQNAESVYQLTRRNTETMRYRSIPLKSRSVCITKADLALELD
ncbi:hypothetical protein BBJ28_00021127 [Nothophytophthora sp. Chile5]|nr:hypothetical protein BBJ28_00021127 [Nothophytophthora sp. Chile5]